MSDGAKNLVESLLEEFGEYPVLGTSEIKRHTTDMVDNYVNGVLSQAMNNKPLTLVREHEVTIKDSFTIKLDKALLDSKGGIKLHLEQKSYGDIDMLKRYLADSYCLVQRHPNVINVAFCLQPATPTTTFSSACDQFSFLEEGRNLFLYTLVDTMRSSKKDKEYLLQENKQILISKTDFIINSIGSLL